MLTPALLQYTTRVSEWLRRLELLLGWPVSQQYFQRNVAIPLLDHIIMCLDQQFSPSAIIATSLLGLVPSILCSKEVSLETAIKKYESDLPSPELFQMELRRWKNRYLSMPSHLRPASPALAIKGVILQFFLTSVFFCRLPVHSQSLLVSVKEVPVLCDDSTNICGLQWENVAFRTLHYSIFTTIRQWTLTEW